MLRTRILLVAASAIVIYLLFLLPKVVVENESSVAPADTTSSVSTVQPTPHKAATPALKTTIADYRRQFDAAGRNQKSSIFADSLRDLYTRAGQFDSAAWFAENAASFLKSTESYLRAGNSYYEAYTFAVEPAKQQEMASKTREYLGKVLESDPANLDAKTRIAMTYLSSGTPMQGIRLLREVLQADPRNEFALFNMGMLSIQSGQYDRAIERLIELVAVNPDHIQGQLLLGVAYLNKGMSKEARGQFERVKKMSNDPSVHATADSYLKDLK